MVSKSNAHEIFTKISLYAAHKNAIQLVSIKIHCTSKERAITNCKIMNNKVQHNWTNTVWVLNDTKY